MGNLQEAPRVADTEMVMRRVPKLQLTRDEPNGPERPSSAAFLQDGPDGKVSVYLKSETTPEAVLGSRLETYLVEVQVGTITMEEGLEVIRTPKKGDLGHCDVIGRKTKSKRKHIAGASQWIPGFGPSDSA
jgi:hypothetical protein